MGVIVASPGSGVAWQVPAEEAGALRAVRQALAAAAPGSGRVALHLPGPYLPNRRRTARIVLQDTARADGARVLEATEATAGLLLLGATAEGAGRAEAILAPLLAAPDTARRPQPIRTWRLPEDATSLIAWAEAADRRAAGGPVPAVGAPTDLEVLLDRLAAEGNRAEGVWIRRAVIRLLPGRPPALAWRRVVLSRRALADGLGRAAAAADPDLLHHAAEGLVRRFVARIPPALRGSGAAAMLPLPQEGAIPAPPDGPGAVGVLPLAAAFAPDAAARQQRLQAAGWRLAFDGLDAAALHLVRPEALPPEALLLLRWSPTLADERAALAALRGVDSARLVLTGCDGGEALAWGMARGIAHLAGPAIEALRSGSAPAGEAGR